MNSRSTSALPQVDRPTQIEPLKKSAAKPRRRRSCRSGTWPISIPGSTRRKSARDLEKMDSECVAFETDYKGKLADRTAQEGGGAWLAEAVRRYEAIDDLAGRLGSYAGLVHAGDSVDPAISKFYGDVSERLTAASLHLLFFALELNRIDDAVIERAMQTPELAHYRPWLEDLRKDKPYQLEDRVEQLFHEKSQSGYAAWNRLFDQTISGLRFKVGGKELAIEPTLNLLQDRDGEKRKAAAAGAGQNLQGQRAHLCADHQHARQGQGNLRPLARLPRRRGLAASQQPRRARGGRCAGRLGARGLSEAVASLLPAEGRLVQQEEAGALGPQRAAAVRRHRQHRLAGGQEHGADGLSRLLAGHGRDRRAVLRPIAGSMRRCGPARRRAPSRIRPRRRRTPTC